MTTGTGNPQTAIDLTSIVALQNVPPSAVVEFRIVNYGASGAGTWYLNSLSAVGADFALVGTVNSASPDAPTISSFTPGSGAAGATVTVTGSNLNGATSVAFNSLAAASFSVIDATTISAVVPSGARTGRITVTTPNGTATSSTDFIPLDGSGAVALQNGGLGSFSGKNLFGRSLSGQTVRFVYAPPSAGTVEGLRVTVPTEFGAPLLANVSVTGTGSAGAVVGVSGQVITITGLSASSPNAINVDISGLSTPDTSTPITNTGRYAFSVESRGSGGTFAALASQPSASVLIPLANARNADPVTFVPVLLNQLVAVEGTCLVGRLGTGSTSTMLQDGNLGIALYSLSAVLGPQTRGNRYAAVGTVAQFNGVVQLVLGDPSLLVDLGAATDPAPTTVSVTDFNSNGVTYQSRVTRIENLSFVSGTWAVGQNVILQDPSANQVTIRIQQNSTATTAPTYPVTITGIGGQFDNASPFDTGFQLQPRDPADLTPAILPSISVNPTSLTSLTATQGNFGPSTNFLVNASNLTNNISVTANDPTNFAISSDNSLFTNTLTLPTNASGAVTNASVFVRLTGAAQGVQSNTVSLLSGSTSTNVTVTGTVAPPPTPAVAAAPTNVGPLQSLQGSPSASPYGTYTLSGTAITNSVSIAAPLGLEISYTNDGSGFVDSLVIPVAPPGGTFSTNVFVRIASTAGLGAFTNFITNSTIGGTSNTLVQVSGEVLTAGAAVITPANGATFPGFTATRPDPSTNQQISVSGSNLPANLTITPPAGWEISATNSNNPTTNSIVLATNPAGIVSATPLFIRMASSPVATNYTNSILRLVSGTNTNSITLLGTVNNPPPVLTLSTNTLTNFSTLTNTFSAFTNFTVTGTNLTSNVTVTPPAGWQVSPTNTNSFSSNAITIGTNAGGGVITSIFLRIGQVATATNFTNSMVTVASGSTVTNLIAAGSVTSTITAPTIASFAPTNGPRGTLVTINGSGFSTVSSNGVSFGGVAATNFTIVGSNQVDAVVPLAAPTGRITVSNPVGVATSSINFTIDALRLRVPPLIGGGVTTPARVSVPSPVPVDTLVILQSSVVPTITVPATVTIPAGQSYVVFPITTTTVGANVNGSISAFSANYLGATAPTTVSSTFTRAASFMEEGYAQDFATFTNNRTLPYGWSNNPTVLNYTAWGTTNTGLKFSTETVRVFGVQHPVAVAGNSQVLTLRNDTGTNVSQIRITYTGRTTNAFTNVDRFPAYTVTVAAAVNTNVVNFTTNVSDLNYSTGAGDNVVVTAKLALTNAAVTNGIPAWTNFTVTWASSAGDGFDNSAQIGLGDLTVELVRPYVQLTPVAGVNDFITTTGTPSVARLFYASGQDLQGALAVTAPDNFEVSLAESTGYGPSVSLTPVAGTVAPTFVYARIKASAPAPQAAPATVGGILFATSAGATTAEQPISGVVFAAGGAVQVLASPEALTNFTSIRPDASAAQAFFASGVNLSNNITVSATTGFQVSLSQTNGFATGVTIPRDAFNRVAPTPVYTRLAPNQSAGAKSGTATIGSGAASDTLILGGTVSAPPPFITIAGVYSNFGTVERGTNSIAQSNGLVSATDLVAPLVLAAPEGFEISTNGGSTYTETISFTPVGGNVATNRIWVRIADYAPAANPLAGDLTASSAGAVTRSWGLTGTVTTNTNAWISARPSSLTGFITLTNTPSDAQTFTVQAANITQDLRVSATDKYEISLDGASYSNSLTLPRQITGSGGGGGFSIIGSDTASNYGTPAANTWTNGSDLGEGFGPWQFVVATNTGFAGVFVGNPADAGITGFPSPAFGMYANPGSSGAEATINRSFDAPLDIGQTFSFQWAINWDSDVGNKGFSIFAGASEIVNVNQSGFPGNITFNGTNTAIPFGTGPMTWSMRRTAADNLEVTSSARDGTTTPVFTTNIAIASDPTSFRWYVSAMGAGDQRQPYFNNLQITAPGGGDPGDVELTTLFVRLKAQPGVPGAADGTITASAVPAASRTIALSGRVPSAPTINVSPSALTGFVTTAGTNSPVQSFTVDAQTLGGALNIAAPSGFEISLVSTNGFGPSLALTPTNESVASTTIFVRFAASATAGDYTNSLVQLSANGLLGQTATNTVILSGTVYANNGQPQLSLPVPSSLAGFATTAGTPSTNQSFIVSGINLTAPITASVSAPYEISSGGAAGPYSSSATSAAPSPNPGSVNAAQFHVRIAATAVSGSPAGTVTLSSAGASNRTVALNGTVASTPALSATPTALTNFQSVAGFPSSPAQSFELRGTNIAAAGSGFAPVTVTASGPFEVSLNNTDWAASTNATPAASSFTNTVYVRVVSNAVAGNIAGAVNFSGQGITNFGPITVPTVTLAGSTLPRPVITVAPTSLGPFTAVSGDVSAPPLAFTVSGTNLLANILVAAPASYEITTNTNNAASWTNLVTLSQTVSPPDPLAPPVVVGSDSATNYGGVWNNGDNRGSGFGPWIIAVNTNTGGFAGNFIGDPAFAGITGMSTQSFGLYANPAASAASVSATRSLLAALQTNQTFSFQWAVNFDTGSTNYKGFRLFAGSTQLVEVGQNGFPGDLRLVAGATTNTNLGIAYGTGPMTWSFSMTNANTLRVTSTARTNPSTIAFATNLTVSAAPDSFVWFAGAMTTNDFTDQRQPYFNDLQITGPASGSNGVVSNTTVWVRLKAAAAVGAANQAIDVTSPIYAEPRQVTLTGQVLPVPVLSVTPAQITGLEIVQLDPATATVGTFNLSGSNLQTNVTVAAPAGFQISAASGSGYTNALSFAPAGSNVTTNVFVRMANSATIGPVSGNVVFGSLYGTNRQTNLARPVSGDVVSWVERNPNGILVTNPPVPTSTGLSNYLYQGLAGINLSVTNLTWYNSNTDQTNVFAFSTNWSANVPLAVGDNFVSFYGQFPTSPVETNTANDSPSALSGPYASGWFSGQNNGTGFGPWQLTASSALADFLILNRFSFPEGSNNINYGTSQFFSAFTLRANFGASALAYRPLSTALAPLGGVVQILFDSNELQPGGEPSSSVGVSFVGTNRSSMVRFFAFSDGGAPVFRIQDKLPAYTLTNWAYTTNGYALRFETLTGNRYKLTAVGAVVTGAVTNAVTNTHTGDLPIGAQINGLEFFNNSGGPSPECNFYIGSIQQFATSYTLADAEAIAPVVLRLAGAAAAYDPWAASYGLVAGGNGAPGADPDNDGFANEMEFAFGTSPVAANASMQSVHQAGGNLVFKFLARRTGVTYGVQSKANLGVSVPDWAPAPGIAISVDGDQSGSFDNVNYERRTFSVPIGSQNFFRIEALIAD